MSAISHLHEFPRGSDSNGTPLGFSIPSSAADDQLPVHTRICTRSAIDLVITSATINSVISRTANKNVIPGTTADAIVTTITPNDIIATETGDYVITWCSIYSVVARSTNYCCRQPKAKRERGNSDIIDTDKNSPIFFRP